MSRRLDAFGHARHTAHAWLTDIGQVLDTDDRRFAYTEAIRTLAAGLELAPGAGADEQRRLRAGHLATEMLLAVEKPAARPAPG